MEMNQLEAQLQAIIRRLHRIEEYLKIPHLKDPEPQTTKPPQSPLPPKPITPTPPPMRPQSTPSRTEPEQELAPRSEGKEMGNLLGIVAVLCFVLAASFLIKLSIDSGWLTPLRQIMLAGTFGLLLIVAGTRKESRDSSYASLLPAAGVIILYLTVAGGRAFYNLYSAEIAVAMMSAVSILVLYLFSLLQQEIYVGVAVVGSYLSSIFMAQVDPIAFSTYFLIWDVTFGLLAVFLESRLMILLSAYLGFAMYQIMVSTVYRSVGGPDLTYVAIFQFVQFIVFSFSTAFYAVRNRRPMNVQEAWAFFPLLLFFYGIEYSLIVRISPELAPWISLGFAGIVYILYAISKMTLGGEPLGSSATVTAFVSIVVLHSLYFEILSSRGQLWAAVLLILSVPFLIKRFDFSGRHRSVLICILFVVIFGYVRSILALEHITVFEGLSIQLVYFLALGGLYLFGMENKGEGSPASLVLLLAHGQFLVGSYRLWPQLASFLTIPAEVIPFLVSTTWGLFAVATLLWAKGIRDTVMAYSSLGILAVATFKVFLYDVATAAPLVRIFCLVAMGVILYFCGYQLRTIGSWRVGRKGAGP